MTHFPGTQQLDQSCAFCPGETSSPEPQPTGFRQASLQACPWACRPNSSGEGFARPPPLPSARGWLCPRSPGASGSGRAGMCLPACRQGTAPVTSGGHAGPGEDMCHPGLQACHCPFEFPTQADCWPLLLAHLPSLCGLHVKVSGPSQGLCGMVTLPSPSASSPAAASALPFLPSLDQSSHWHALMASLRAGGRVSCRGGKAQEPSLRAEEPALLQGLTHSWWSSPVPPPHLFLFLPHDQGPHGLYREIERDLS